MLNHTHGESFTGYGALCHEGLPPVDPESQKTMGSPAGLSPLGSLEEASDGATPSSGPESPEVISVMGDSLAGIDEDSVASRETEEGSADLRASMASAAALKLLRVGSSGGDGLDPSGSLVMRSSARGERWTSAYARRAAERAAARSRRRPR